MRRPVRVAKVIPWWPPGGGPETRPAVATSPTGREGVAVDQATELEWLRERVKGLETALHCSRRELLDVRCRLALIARATEDLERAKRAPGVVFGAINAALYSETQNLRQVRRHLTRRPRRVL